MPMIPENPTPGRPWGRALRRTPDELARLTSADAMRDAAGDAERNWRKNAKTLKGLLKGKRKKPSAQ
jgi:hypothetical protein